MIKSAILTSLFLVSAAAQAPPPPDQVTPYIPLSTPPEAPPTTPYLPSGMQDQVRPGQPFSAQQLNTLVAPIALYPDSLLSQVLVACTYPAELTAAQNWLQQHPELHGTELMNAAKQQPWDPSVQALVAFPDVLNRLTQDPQWTTQLGDAFLTQQADVMAAVQRMRAAAKANGKLTSTPEQTVQTEAQNGQTAITIQPTNPDLIYVPNYNPEYVWGPPVWGVYPPLYYPGIDVGFAFGPGIPIGLYFGGWAGWGWGGWGWSPAWFSRTIVLNNSFLHRFGFHDFHGGDSRTTAIWAHNPAHRWGVPYSNRNLVERFRNTPGAGFNEADRFRTGIEPGLNRGFAAAPRFGRPEFEQHNFAAPHSAFGGIRDGGMARMQSDHGFAGMGGRNFGGFAGPRGGAIPAPRGGRR